MTNEVTEPNRRSSRRSMRRDQILCAAHNCFRKFGFHSASMAQISTTSGLSVGHIYRYFESKEEIIAAIVRDQVDAVVSNFPSSSVSKSEAQTLLAIEAKRAARAMTDSDGAGLMIEIRAEASRNPAIAEILRSADTMIAERIGALIGAGASYTMDTAEIERRSEFLAIVVDGLIFRSAVNPEIDFAIVDQLIDLVCRGAVFDAT